jgi:hypothetical protein
MTTNENPLAFWIDDCSLGNSDTDSFGNRTTTQKHSKSKNPILAQDQSVSKGSLKFQSPEVQM